MTRIAANSALLGLALWGTLVAVSAAREWVDKTGAHKVEGEFVGQRDGYVLLKLPNGKAGRIPINRLSEGDQQYLATQPAVRRPAARKVNTPSAADVQAARDRFDEAVSENPTDPKAYFERALARSNAGQA